jgi:putative tricarboxylic transport membrane protein
MWSNALVGSITTLALLLLFWPLISKLLAVVRRPKKIDPVLAEQPVD